MSAFVFVLSAVKAGGAAFPPTTLRKSTFTVAMCMICSAKLRCGGVDWSLNLSSGIASAMAIIISFWLCQSLMRSARTAVPPAPWPAGAPLACSAGGVLPPQPVSPRTRTPVMTQAHRASIGILRAYAIPRLTESSRALILASASPRRAELLRAAGFEFDVLPADVDESFDVEESPDGYVRRIAQTKAEVIAARITGRPVLAADTVVLVDNAILG